ncbi:MAG TPA: transcriptional regulator [Ruminococcaceae bacterium]|nr:transcriptional regulator [Oscillospiraceae bacterium]
MDVLKRIEQLRDERGWSNYKLSQMTGVSQTTLRNMFTRNTLPGIATLESICQGFGITLSQFFASENEPITLDDEQKAMLETWGALTKEQKEALLILIRKQ